MKRLHYRRNPSWNTTGVCGYININVGHSMGNAIVLHIVVDACGKQTMPFLAIMSKIRG